MFQRHSSDESLIAWLDGELPFYRRALVRGHLAVCWKCRLRLSQIEKQILDVTHAFEEDTFPGPERVVRARLRFLEETGRLPSPVESARPAWGRRMAWAAACLVLAAGGWWVSRRPAAAPPVLVASDVVQQAEQAEARLIRGPVQQEFRVLARQLRPREVSVESRLEVWSEPGEERFASRLSGSGGALRHALWHPDSDRSYVYNPTRSPDVVSWSPGETRAQWSDLLLREGVTLEYLEQSLMSWLENRPWRPVALSSGLALATAGDDEALQAEAARAATGEEIVRLSVWKRSGTVSVGFILEVDPRTFLPRLQCIRYESPSRSLELWMIPEPVHARQPAVYEPPTVRAASPPPLPLYAEPSAPRISTAPPPIVDPVLAQIEVYYALHRLGACLGEAVEVARGPDGELEVRGVVVDAARKEQIAAALAGTAARVDVKSVQEAVGNLGPDAAPVTQHRPAPTKPLKETLASLYAYFSRDEAALDRFADRALSQGQDLIFEAQALHQLAGAFLSRGEPSSTRARRLLDVMMYDHVRDLQSKVEAAWQLVSPPLLTAAGAEYAPRVEAERGSARTPAEESEEIFRLSRLLNEHLQALFSSGGQPTEALTRDVLNAFPPLQSALRAASGRALRAGAPRQ